MHARPGRIAKDIVNPFGDRSPNESPTDLRLSREFMEMREQLVNSIRHTKAESLEVA